MTHHKGLRMSFAGLILFMVSIVSFAFVGGIPFMVGMVVGGSLVWAGLIRTLAEMAQTPPEEPFPPA